MRSRPLRSCPRATRWIFCCFLAASTLPLCAADLPPAKAATDYPAVDNHAKEQVAIAAVPFDTAQECRLFQVDYLKYRFIPIRIIVTNNGDRPISLRDARIFLISANNDRIPAAEPEDVERRVSATDSRGRDIPLGPIKVHTKGKASDNKIEADFDRWEYSALVVEPHTTHDGFLFYDVDGLGDTPLHNAKLVLRELRNADGQQLFFFEIPFNKYLATQH
ncbi:MAG TPA: hypothetical protein VHX13_10850 [Acidobacteriaceae bacterium]|nr:hypothetical protein [Acidobacteriaceae bacterium]